MTWTKVEDPDPDVWIECDGREIDPVKFPKLRALASHTPNYLERFLRGGTKENVGEQQEDVIGKHKIKQFSKNTILFKGSPENIAYREDYLKKYLYINYFDKNKIDIFTMKPYLPSYALDRNVKKFIELLANQIQEQGHPNNFLLEDDQKKYFTFYTNAWNYYGPGNDYAYSIDRNFFNNISFPQNIKDILKNYYITTNNSDEYIEIKYDRTLYIGNPDVFGNENETRPAFVYQRFFIKGA